MFVVSPYKGLRTGRNLYLQQKTTTLGKPAPYYRTILPENSFACEHSLADNWRNVKEEIKPPEKNTETYHYFRFFRNIF
jgi:hypothetical protein